MPPGATMWDESPPDVFLAQVDRPLDSLPPLFANDASAFFGQGGPANATGSLVYRASGLPEQHAALIAATNISLSARSTVHIRFVYGYVPRGSPAGFADKLVGKYTPIMQSGEMLRYITDGWRPNLVNFSMPSAPALGPEVRMLPLVVSVRMLLRYLSSLHAVTHAFTL